MNQSDDIVAAVAPVVGALNALQVRHYIGGSVASSFHGAARSTIDVDVVAELEDKSVNLFLQQIGNDYYSSEPAIRDAIRRNGSFNLIHLPTSFKIDVFISRDRSFDRDCMSRAVHGEIGTVNKLEILLASPEDTIISKLEWYQLGNETSDRQWRDVSTMMKLQGDQIDVDYLHQAAATVGVTDLLARLLKATF